MTTNPSCHIDRKYYSNGLCKECYLRSYNQKYQKENKDKISGRKKAYYSKNRDAKLKYEKIRNANPNRKIQKRSSYLTREYGITDCEFNILLDKQGGLCAICKRGDIQLLVDHCHKQDNIRGLLCNNCNLILGHAHDDAQILKLAIKYLMEQKI